jgi:predicted nucleic-acid-binding protein
VTVDTNILVRATVDDDPRQASLAGQLRRTAEVLVIPITVLCEFVWVTTCAYSYRPNDVAAAIRALLATSTVQVDRTTVEAGLAMLDAGGDFADGVIAFEGRRLGGPVFASFDRRATELIAATGAETHLLG